MTLQPSIDTQKLHPVFNNPIAPKIKEMQFKDATISR